MAIADRARRQAVFSHPPRNLVSRAVIGAQNTIFRLRGSEFRVFAHPPTAMLHVLAAHGMRPATVERTIVWQVSTAER